MPKKESLTHVMSSEVKVKFDEQKPLPPTRGPQSGMDQLTDAKFVETYANDLEWATFRHAIEERRAKDPGLQVWVRCSHCRVAMQVRPTTPEGDNCALCNMTKRSDLGHLRRMSEAEVTAYLKAKAQADAVEIERLRRADYNAYVDDQRKYGREPLNYENWRAKRTLENMARVQDEQRLFNSTRKP